MIPDDEKLIPLPYRDLFSDYDEYLDAKVEYQKPEYWMDEEPRKEDEE